MIELPIHLLVYLCRIKSRLLFRRMLKAWRIRYSFLRYYLLTRENLDD